ncbi:MAG: hypothetical protein LBV80_07845 [Deltaproteobacteria bacterium]|jgi:hypothetical protein|nr:hypothetical protein [Deltaproteobacteria bacterium]
MNIGDVLYFHDFGFDDGGHANKLLVVLSDPANGSMVMVIATSKGTSKDIGCQPKNKRFFIRAGTYEFPKDTWLDLYRNPIIRDTTQTQAAIASGGVQTKGTLPAQLVNEIKNCLTKHSPDSLTREACRLLGVTPKW